MDSGWDCPRDLGGRHVGPEPGPEHRSQRSDVGPVVGGWSEDVAATARREQQPNSAGQRVSGSDNTTFIGVRTGGDVIVNQTTHHHHSQPPPSAEPRSTAPQAGNPFLYYS